MIKELYEQGTKKSKEQPVPVEWAEMKVANIRHAAIEKLISLVPDNSGVSVKIINKNYIQINTTDSESGTPLIFGFYLRSAINLHLLMDTAEFQMNLEDSREGGLKFISDPLSEEGLEQLRTAEAAVVSGVDLKALYEKLKQKEKLEDKKEKEKWAYISLKIILQVDKEDFERMKKPLKVDNVPAVDSLEDMFVVCGGVDRELFRIAVAPVKDQKFAVKVAAVLKFLKEENEIKEKDDLQMKIFKEESKNDEIEALKKKQKERRDKQIEETEKLEGKKEEKKEEESQEIQLPEIEYKQYLSDPLMKEKLNQIYLDKLCGEDSDPESKKSEKDKKTLLK